MNLINATQMHASFTQGLDRDAREWLVIVVRGTFWIPKHDDEEPTLAKEQIPAVTADVFTGQPGFSAPRYESDYALIKPRCDVLLHGSAYAPGGRPIPRVQVSMRIGPLVKTFDVVGQRTWEAGLLAVSPGPVEPFFVMPFSYDNAFGGTDTSDPDSTKHVVYHPNPVGRGFGRRSSRAMVGKPLPNTEETGRPVTDPQQKYRPMAYGPIGRAWPDRIRYAGTYDQHWMDNVSPFLPNDFQDQYFQTAPVDQQIDYPIGGEKVFLENLTPEGRCGFKLPRVKVPVIFILRRGYRQQVDAVIDTVVIEPDLRRFFVTWRARFPVQRNIFEVEQIIAGTMSRGWYRARALGKRHFGSLRSARPSPHPSNVEVEKAP